MTVFGRKRRGNEEDANKLLRSAKIRSDRLVRRSGPRGGPCARPQKLDPGFRFWGCVTHSHGASSLAARRHKPHETRQKKPMRGHSGSKSTQRRRQCYTDGRPVLQVCSVPDWPFQRHQPLSVHSTIRGIPLDCFSAIIGRLPITACANNFISNDHPTTFNGLHRH